MKLPVVFYAMMLIPKCRMLGAWFRSKTEKNLHFPDVAVQFSQRQKAAHVRRRHILLHPRDALGEGTGKQVFVRDLHD